MKTKKFLVLGWAFLFVFCLALGGPARAEDVPEGIGSDSEELPLPGDQEQLTDDLPAPSLGNAPPTVKKGEPMQDSYLPADGGVAEEYYTPGSGGGVELPVAGSQGPALYTGGGSNEELFPRETNFDRPSFQMYVGGASRSYPTVAIPDPVAGVGMGLSYRVMRLGQTVFLHAMGEITYFYVGTVVNNRIPGGWPGVKDKTYHVGGLLEVGLGRSFSLIGGITRRWNDITTDPHKGTPDEERILANVGEEERFHLGLGLQYDFHVVPHGRLGARLYAEQDYGMLSFVMAIEPAPKPKNMSLNYRGI